MFSFSERYRVYTEAHKAGANGGQSNSTVVTGMYEGGHMVSSKQYDELVMVVSINVLVRVLFWTLLLRTGKRYLSTLITFRLADRAFEDALRRQDEPRAPMVLSVATPVATATVASHVV